VAASRGAGAIPLLYISRYSAPIFLCASAPLCLLFRLFSRPCVSTSPRPRSSSRRLCGDRPHRRAWPTTQYVARGRHVTDERSAPPECLRCSIPRGDGIALAAVPVEAHPDRRLLAGGKLRRPALHPRRATSLMRFAPLRPVCREGATPTPSPPSEDGPHPRRLRAAPPLPILGEGASPLLTLLIAGIAPLTFQPAQADSMPFRGSGCPPGQWLPSGVLQPNGILHQRGDRATPTGTMLAARSGARQGCIEGRGRAWRGRVYPNASRQTGSPSRSAPVGRKPTRA